MYQFIKGLVHGNCGCATPAPSTPSPCATPAPPCATTPPPCATTQPPCSSPAPSTTPKPKVYVNKQPPIVINRKAQSYVVNAGPAVVIKPAAVVIQRPGQCETVPYTLTVTAKPIIVKKKIIQVSRPIIKKYFVEQYSKTEDCNCKDKVVGVQQPPSPSGCSSYSSPSPSPAPCSSNASPYYPVPQPSKPCGCPSSYY